MRGKSGKWTLREEAKKINCRMEQKKMYNMSRKIILEDEQLNLFYFYEVRKSSEIVADNYGANEISARVSNCLIDKFWKHSRK